MVALLSLICQQLRSEAPVQRLGHKVSFNIRSDPPSTTPHVGRYLPWWSDFLAVDDPKTLQRPP